MNELVKACYNQLIKNNDNVVLLTKDNCNKFCNIPEYIYDRVYNGDLSVTHFSDILRFSILAENGGLWVDSTCWIIGKIPKQVLECSFISPKTKNLPNIPLWSNSRWCIWCIGTNQKENSIFMFVKDTFFKLLKEKNNFPFYLFSDYLVDYIYRNFDCAKQMIDSVPENNVKRNDLHFLLNKLYDEKTYSDLCVNNWVFKLSYKTLWNKKTPNGESTFYETLLSSE